MVKVSFWKLKGLDQVSSNNSKQHAISVVVKVRHSLQNAMFANPKKTKKALDELNLYIEKGTPDGYEESFRDAADESVDIRAGKVIFKI